MLSIRSAKQIGNILLFRKAVAVLAAVLVLFAGAAPNQTAAAAAAGTTGKARPSGTSAATSGEGACPLTTPVFKASLDAKAYGTAVGVPAHLRVRLRPRNVPEGFFVTSIIDVLSGPPGPKPVILTGHPVSDVTPRQAGAYRLRVLVNLIAKSSCAGVKAVTLLDQEVVLTAR